MTDPSCRGCGAAGGDCQECSHSNWAISCGCDHHGDHLGCGKSCELYGCAHPRGLELAGTLEESERYRGELPPRHLVARALEEARTAAEKRHERRLLKLKRIELSLDTYPDERVE